MVSGYNLEVQLPHGSAVGKKEIGNSQGFGLNKSVIGVVRVRKSLTKVGNLEQRNLGWVRVTILLLMLGHLTDNTKEPGCVQPQSAPLTSR